MPYGPPGIPKGYSQLSLAGTVFAVALSSCFQQMKPQTFSCPLLAPLKQIFKI